MNLEETTHSVDGLCPCCGIWDLRREEVLGWECVSVGPNPHPDLRNGVASILMSCQREMKCPATSLEAHASPKLSPHQMWASRGGSQAPKAHALSPSGDTPAPAAPPLTLTHTPSHTYSHTLHTHTHTDSSEQARWCLLLRHKTPFWTKGQTVKQGLEASSSRCCFDWRPWILQAVEREEVLMKSHREADEKQQPRTAHSWEQPASSHLCQEGVVTGIPQLEKGGRGKVTPPSGGRRVLCALCSGEVGAAPTWRCHTSGLCAPSPFISASLGSCLCQMGILLS